MFFKCSNNFETMLQRFFSVGGQAKIFQHRDVGVKIKLCSVLEKVDNSEGMFLNNDKFSRNVLKNS